MNHVIIRKIIVVVLVLSISVPALMTIGSSHGELNYSPQSAASTSSQNYSYIKFTYVIPTGAKYDGFHQVGSVNGGLTASQMHSGVISHDGNILYTTTSSMSISEINVTTWKTIRTVTVPASIPIANSTSHREWISNIAFVPSTGLIYATVVNSIDVPFQTFDISNLYAIDPLSGSVVGSVPLDNYSSGLVYDQNNGMLYAVSAVWHLDSGLNPTASYINEVNPANMALVERIQIPGLNLKQIAYNSARDQIYIPIYWNASLLVFNTSTGNMTNINLPNGNLFAPTYVTYSSKYVYVAAVASNNISVINESSQTFAYNIHLPSFSEPTAISYDVNRSMLYLADMSGNIISFNSDSSNFTGTVSAGTPTEALIYNSQSGETYAVGSGKQAYLSVLGLGPAHSLSFRSIGLLGPAKWTLTANGVQYNAVNGSVSFTTAGNSTQYYVTTYAPYLVIPWAGSINGIGNSGVTIIFINLFIVLIPLLVIASLVIARKIMKNRKE